MMNIIAFASLIAVAVAGYAPGAQLAYSAPVSYSNVYNSPLAYSRFGAGVAASPLAYSSPLAYNGYAGSPLAYAASPVAPLAYSNAVAPLAYSANSLGYAANPLAYSANPLAYSAYNSPYLRSGLARPYNYLY